MSRERRRAHARACRSLSAMDSRGPEAVLSRARGGAHAPRMPRPPLVAALLLAQLSAHATALDDNREARARVDAALAAHGGVDKIEALGAVTVTVAGERFMFGQSRTLASLDAESSRITTSFDRAHDRIAQENDQTYPGGYLLRYRTVLTPSEGYSLDIGRSFDGPVLD